MPESNGNPGRGPFAIREWQVRRHVPKYASFVAKLAS